MTAIYTRRAVPFIASLIVCALALTVHIQIAAAGEDTTLSDTAQTETKSEDYSRLLKDREMINDQLEAAKKALEEKRKATERALEERKKNLDEKRATVTDKMMERKAALDESKKERIKKYAENMIERLGRMIGRLRAIADRVESRIDKLEERFGDRGLDLSNSRDLLETARTKIDTAELTVEQIETELPAALASSTPKEAFGVVRGLFDEAKQSIKDVHRALRDTVQSIRVALGKIDTAHDDDDDDDTSTTTSTTTNTN